MTKDVVDRGNWFLRDGQYFPFFSNSGEVDWSHPAHSVMHSSLWNYDNAVRALGDHQVIGQPRGVALTPDHGEVLEGLDSIRPDAATDMEPAKTKEEFKRDVVAHYTNGEIETIDYIFDKLGYEGGMAYIIGNEIKYSSRANHKGCRRADMIKMRNYATIALEHMDKNGELE